MPLPAARAASTCSRPSIARTSAITSARGRSQIAGSSAIIRPAPAIAARRVRASR